MSKRASRSPLSAGNNTSDIPIISATVSTKGPDVDKFTADELSIFDADGFTRTFLTIKFAEMTDAIYDGMKSISRLQYAIPIKYLKPVDGTYSYISQKAYSSVDNDIANASIVIEPLNNSYAETIPYTPINQHLPLNTPVTINVSVPFDTLPDGNEPDRQFIWSNNLQTSANIEDIIKKEYPASIRTKPWQECVHYGSIDVGSKMECKFLVAMSDANVTRSFTTYGFKFDHDEKELVIWVFKCFNLTPMEVLTNIKNNEKCCDESKRLIDAILEKVKKDK